MSFLLINKPAGITSHDVIDRVRRITGERKVGHAGTLDPFATGLLIVAVGRSSTKRLSEFVKLDKSYRAAIHFGGTSDTQDRTGVITTCHPEPAEGSRPSQQELEAALKKFTGPQKQTPPMYSAKKVGGKKLYELARAGKTIERDPVDITIHSLELVSYDWPRAVVDVSCTSGTYIRTLGADIGDTLGVGAYLDELERTSIDSHLLNNSVVLKDLTQENWMEHTRDLT